MDLPLPYFDELSGRGFSGGMDSPDFSWAGSASAGMTKGGGELG